MCLIDSIMYIKALLTGEPENDYSKSDIMQILSTVSEGSSSEWKIKDQHL